MDFQYLFAFLIALILSPALMSLLIRNSAKLGLMDEPTKNDRKIHSEAMPRSGGLGIIVAASLALVLVLPVDESLSGFMLGSLVIICFGLVDDIVDLNPIQKLAGQALGVVIAMAGGMVMSDLPLLSNTPAWLSYGVTFFFMLSVINGVNFSDGMDGLAAGTTLMALLLILTLALESNNTQVAAIALAISAAMLGFLRFNTHPAKIFLGDAGSQFLGFVVAWLVITLSQSATSPITTLMPLLVLGIPIMDILQVIAVRIHKKLPLPGPDKEHIHHQLAKLAFRQDEVVAIIYLLQASLLCGAYIMRFSNDQAIFGFYIVYIAIILGIVYSANVSGWKVRAGLLDDTDARNTFFRRWSMVHPYTGKLFGLFIALFLATAALLSINLDPYTIYIALAWALMLLVIYLFARNRWPLALGRLAAYTAVCFLCYNVTVSTTSQVGNWLIDGVIAVSALALLFAIRITRKDYFWLTTQDLLVLLFIVILAPQLSTFFGQNLLASALIFRTCVLLYICEYVLARGPRARKNLTLATIFALCLNGLHL